MESYTTLIIGEDRVEPSVEARLSGERSLERRGGPFSCLQKYDGIELTSLCVLQFSVIVLRIA